MHHFKPVLGLCLALIALFSLYYPDLVFHSSTRISDPKDSILNYWMLMHSLQSLSPTGIGDFWHGNIFYPSLYTKALSDTLLFQALLLSPLYHLGIDTFRLYHGSILLFFVLNGVCAYVLFGILTKEVLTRFLGAILFASNALWFYHLSHYQLLATFWYPLMGYLIYCYHKQPSTKHIAYLGLGLLGLAATSPYLFMLSLPTLLILALIFLFRPPSKGHPWPQLILILLPTLGLIAAFYWPYTLMKDLYGLARTTKEQGLYSAQLSSYLDPMLLNPLSYWKGQRAYKGEATLFLPLSGVLILTFGFVGWLKTWRKKPPILPPLAGMALCITLINLGLTLGPYQYFLGEINVWRAFSWIPGFSGIRVPARAGFFVYLGVAFLSVYILAKWSFPYKKWVVLCLLFFHVFEQIPPSSTSVPLPRRDTKGLTEYLNQQNLDESMIVYPLREPEILYLSIAAQTRTKLINGFSGFVPAVSEHFLFPNLEHCLNHICLNMLRSHHVNLVAIFKPLTPIETQEFFHQTASELLFEDGYYVLYRIGQKLPLKAKGTEAYLSLFAPPDTGACFGFELDASKDREELGYMKDSKADTAWNPDQRQSKELALTINLNRSISRPFLITLADLDKTKQSLRANQFIRKPLMTLTGPDNTHVQFDARLHLRRNQGMMEQWIEMTPDSAVQSIRLQAQSARWVDASWGVSRLSICEVKRQSVTQPERVPLDKI